MENEHFQPNKKGFNRVGRAERARVKGRLPFCPPLVSVNNDPTCNELE